MAKGINKVILIGNLGQDPDTRHTAHGNTVVNLSLATDESYKDKNTGQMVPKTEWHRVTVWGKLAEICSQYLSKGSKVYIEGKLETQTWEKDGEKRYTTVIVANEMRMLDGRSEATGTAGQNPSSRQGASSSPTSQAAPQQKLAPVDDFDDDIPF